MQEPKLLPLAPSDGSQRAAPPRSDLYRALAEKEREARAQRGELAAREHLLQLARQRIDAQARQEQALRAEVLARALAEQALRADIATLTSGAAWRLVQRLRKWRWAFAPANTRRDRMLFLSRRAWSVWRQEGLMAVLRKTARKVLGRTVPAPPDVPAPAAPAPPAAGAVALREPVPPVRAPSAKIDLKLVHEILARAPRRPELSGRPVDVIVPVYKGLHETLRCLRSLLTASAGHAHEIVVINDASPDLLLVACLRKMASRGLITLLDNHANLGFVQSVNRGLALHPDRDVILLNSDTEVYGDWLDRLRRAAHSAPNVGTVTPFSNSATICSYPRFCHDNAVPEDVTTEQLDQFCTLHNSRQSVEVPTGVGFCMFIRRACLSQVGPLDAERFGKGYGEENDFCMRARARGWRHLLAADTFVLHVGGTSFGETKRPAIERALQTLAALHPDYSWQVSSHIAADPALPFRRRLDLARLAGPEPAMLYVTHNLGGGTDRHVVDMATRLEGEGFRAIILRSGEPGRVCLERVGVRGTPNLVFELPGEYWTLREALEELGVEHVHVHHSITLSGHVFDLIRDLNVPYDWTVHDYYPICPRINLIDETNTYCGEPDPLRCNVCLEKSNAQGGALGVDIEQWRQEYAGWLAGARKVLVPHADVAARLARYFPTVEFTERRHFEALERARPVAAPLAPAATLRVAVIGMIGIHKGSEILLRCAQDAQARGLPMHFVVVGITDRDPTFRQFPNVTVTGRYAEEGVFDLLESLQCHCAFIPSVWPETYCYTLSIALMGGLFPVAFDLGAPAARIREAGTGLLLPLTASGARINDELLGLRGRVAEPLREPLGTFVTYPTLAGEYYDLPRRRAKAA